MSVRFTDFYDAWCFLENHPTFNNDDRDFKFTLTTDVVKVNPETLTVEDDESKNTQTRIWLEFGRWLSPQDLPEGEQELFREGIAEHDLDFDCGGATFEEAIITLANKVAKKYPV